MKVRFHRLAVTEMEDTAHYYEGECTGLGEEFLAAVERALQSIR
jgi:hypothetical protein